MAKIRIAGLVGKTNKAGITSWYWQPSKTLREAKWQPLALGQGEGRHPPASVVAAAEARNAEVARWKIGGETPRHVARRVQDGTLGALIRRYRREVMEGKKPDGSRVIAASTARTYAKGLARLEAWAGKQPLAYITPARVRALKNILIGPPEKGGIGHDSAHKMLKMGRQLFAFARGDEVFGPIVGGSNPFEKFGLASPAPRDVIWSPPAREAIVAAAHRAGMPSIALAIQLGFATGQREQDLLALRIGQFVEIAEHKMQPEDHAVLARRAPDGVVRGISIRQQKTRAWIEVPVTGEVRTALEGNIARAKANDRLTVILDDTRQEGSGDAARVAHYSGEAGQTRFQRDFAACRNAAAERAEKDGRGELAAELARLQFRDLRRTCVVYLGELGMDAHLIAAVTGHDIDDTQRILRTYMPRTTGRAARTIALAEARAEARADRAGNPEKNSM